MPTSNLFDIDPDKLFAVCSIEEIQSTQIKLQHEIERKREELRTMVGERYRDLIEAADKITEMKEISQNVIKDIEGVSAAMEHLQEKSVKHNRSIKQEDLHSNMNVKSSVECVAVQLKLLVELPEHIWTALDKDNYDIATQLYMLGRHIKTGLEMDPLLKSNSSPSSNVSNCPLLERQWVAMSQFKDCILKKVGIALQEQNIDPQSACSCFISVALLDNKCSKGLVQYFLSLRSRSLKNTLEAPLQSAEDPSVIKSRFINSHIIVISTMMTLYSLFIESPGETGDGALWRSIRKVVGRDSAPIINIIINNEQEKKLKGIERHRFYHLLPSVISNYRCNPELVLEPLPPSEMASIFSNWLKNVTQLIKESGKALLDKLCSLRSLQGLRDANQELPEEWSLVLQRFIQPTSLSIWSDLYVPLIVDRAKQLITVHWLASLKLLKQHINSIINDMINNDGGKTPENDLHWYIWKENANDLIFTGTQKQSSEHPHQQQSLPFRGVWLKSQGITPRVAEICNLFESQLSSLLNDLSTLYPSCDNASIIDDRDDSKLLQSHQCAQCLEVLTQLMLFVRNEVEKSSGEVVPLLLSRFLLSVTKLCPTLQKCLTAADGKVNAWQEACNMLTSNTNHCWSLWKDRVIVGLNDTITSTLLPPKQLKDLLNMIPQWDVVRIQEVGEAGQPFSSDLLIPSSPSFQLLSVLSSLCSAVSSALVPTYVTEMLVNELVIKIIDVYRNMIHSETETLSCQSKLWQLLFDIKYITALFVQHDNKPLLSKCQEVISQVENSIDPFDLDVFIPYINSNIRRSHRQTQSFLGVLVVSRFTSLFPSANISGSNHQHQSHNEDPSVLALSTSASSAWFPLLPVTAPPGTRAINPVKVKASKVGVTVEQQPQDTQHVSSSKAATAVTSTATSFFGSMTSDWFG